MLFAHDTRPSLISAVILVNSAEEPDGLTTVADLDAFCAEHGYTGRHDRTRAELDQVRHIRPRLRTLLTSAREESVALTNEILAQAQAVPRLVRHDEYDWHVHAVPDDAPLATRILVETAMAMIDLIRSDETSRLGVCADETCDGLVLDLTRNRSRRFCSTQCGNRAAVAAYRARNAG